MTIQRGEHPSKLVNRRGLSRRDALRRGGAGLAAGALAAASIPRAAAQVATPVATAAAPLPEGITAIIEGPHYAFSRWGIHVADRDSGEVVYDLNGNQRFLAASTTKLWPGAAALDAYGPDFHFETPVYRTAPVGADGTLTGNLILVASGDLTMGGRTTPDDKIDYRPIDHIYANTFPLATLTPEDPLAGLDDLARQVAAAGIKRVDGEVIVDARLFPAMEKDDYILTPIWINDNLIDITITPGKEGEPATFVWRPETAAYRVESDVTTVAADQPLGVTITSPEAGVIGVSGQIPVNQGELVQTYQVTDPPAFARTLLIEALGRAGVTVEALAVAPNPDDKLPAVGSYAEADRVALFTSPPFSENIKLIFKVSHNQHADMLIFLLALKHGETSFEAGMTLIRPFLEKLGLDPAAVSLSDGRGNEYTDLFSPRTVTALLRAMATRSDFPIYHDALPILGVDGSEIDTVPASSPVAGKAFAKSGTTVAGDLMNQRALAMTRALAGYLTAKSGRELIFTTYVNDVPLADILDVFTVIKEQGTIAEVIYDLN